MELISQEIANKWAGEIKWLNECGEYKKAVSIYYKLKENNLIPSLKVMLDVDDFDSGPNKQYYLMFYFAIAFERYSIEKLKEELDESSL